MYIVELVTPKFVESHFIYPLANVCIMHHILVYSVSKFSNGFACHIYGQAATHLG
jgi:hypothetical protein